MRLAFFLVRVLYIQALEPRNMSKIIENCDWDQFANGQSTRNLRVDSGVTGPKTQLHVHATEQRPDMELEQFPAPLGKLLGLKLLQAENGMA